MAFSAVISFCGQGVEAVGIASGVGRAAIDLKELQGRIQMARVMWLPALMRCLPGASRAGTFPVSSLP